MIGTTRSRVSTFMNKFRKLGFIQYNGDLKVHNSLLNVVLHDNPHLRNRKAKLFGLSERCRPSLPARARYGGTDRLSGNSRATGLKRRDSPVRRDITYHRMVGAILRYLLFAVTPNEPTWQLGSINAVRRRGRLGAFLECYHPLN